MGNMVLFAVRHLDLIREPHSFRNMYDVIDHSIPIGDYVPKTFDHLEVFRTKRTYERINGLAVSHYYGSECNSWLLVNADGLYHLPIHTEYRDLKSIKNAVIRRSTNRQLPNIPVDKKFPLDAKYSIFGLLTDAMSRIDNKRLFFTEITKCCLHGDEYSQRNLKASFGTTCIGTYEPNTACVINMNGNVFTAITTPYKKIIFPEYVYGEIQSLKSSQKYTPLKISNMIDDAILANLKNMFFKPRKAKSNEVISEGMA